MLIVIATYTSSYHYSCTHSQANYHNCKHIHNLTTYRNSCSAINTVVLTYNKAGGMVPAGSFVNVRITGTADGDLTGEIEE